MAPRILIVEDDPDMADNLQEILVQDGTSADIAPTAEHALDLLLANRYDGVISDFRLPGRSGLELLMELRRTGSAVPVLLISGYMDDATTEAAEEAGALEVMTKPLDLRRLLTAIGQLDRASRSVLIVDDNVELAQNLAEALQARGLATELARSAGEALAKRNLPAIAVLDIHLPDASGLDVARRLAARDPTVRILLLSGYAERYRAEILQLARVIPGFDPESDCLTKPCSTEQLAERLSEASQAR